MISVTQDERERAINRSRKMYQTDMDSNLATAEERGEKRGRNEERLEIARKMKEMGDSIEKIQAITGLPAESIKRI
jgi:predicted transposase/invertase (TIGR01784 family)